MVINEAICWNKTRRRSNAATNTTALQRSHNSHLNPKIFLPITEFLKIRLTKAMFILAAWMVQREPCDKGGHVNR